MACIVILALSSTLPPFVSQNLGAGRLERITEACRLSMRFVLGWQLLIYVLMAVILIFKPNGLFAVKH
jgi:Na+-driven multidrug efflux pump